MAEVSEKTLLQIEDALSRPPAEVGKRLIGERELARKLGISLATLRRVLEDLVRREILVRRQGSGTYVRKVTSPVEIGERFPEHLQLFSEHSKTPVRKQIRLNERSLRIGVWTPGHHETIAAELIYEGVRSHIERRGHKFADLTPPRKNGVQAANILSMEFDGYVIIHPPVAGPAALAFSKIQAPLVYMGSGPKFEALTPRVHIDMLDAAFRSLTVFSQEGFRNVAAMGIAGNSPTWMNDVCVAFAANHGIRRFRFAEARLDKSAIREQLEPLLRGKDAAEAIYFADDVLFGLAAPMFREFSRSPGVDLGVITNSNYGGDLPKGADWSCMEFDCTQFGGLAASLLLRKIQVAGENVSSVAHQCSWIPKATHSLKNQF